MVYDVVVWFFDEVVQTVGAAGVASSSVGELCLVRDLLTASRLFGQYGSDQADQCAATGRVSPRAD